jgi:hypothetical protein
MAGTQGRRSCSRTEIPKSKPQHPDKSEAAIFKK